MLSLLVLIGAILANGNPFTNEQTKDSDNNAVLNSQTNYLAHNSTNCLINGSKNKLIGLVGVSNLAVIDTDDGLLICHLDDSYHVRDLIGKMVKNKKYKSFFLKKP